MRSIVVTHCKLHRTYSGLYYHICERAGLAGRNRLGAKDNVTVEFAYRNTQTFVVFCAEKVSPIRWISFFLD
jgi:hypothetical protein